MKRIVLHKDRIFVELPDGEWCRVGLEEGKAPQKEVSLERPIVFSLVRSLIMDFLFISKSPSERGPYYYINNPTRKTDRQMQQQTNAMICHQHHDGD